MKRFVIISALLLGSVCQASQLDRVDVAVVDDVSVQALNIDFLGLEVFKLNDLSTVVESLDLLELKSLPVSALMSVSIFDGHKVVSHSSGGLPYRR